MTKKPKPWTQWEDERLRILWKAGWSTQSIGRDIGRGKDAVCGRRKRLGLPQRGRCYTPAKPPQTDVTQHRVNMQWDREAGYA